MDGAVLSLQVPGDDEATDDAVPAQLHVVAGPDAGGVHLLHGGQIRIGRSADADVPLDDPDVSRLHCTVTVTDDGRVSVADLGSTNGTSLDGVEVRERPVRLVPGALLRLGESALRLTAGSRPATLPTAPDGEGHLRVTRAETGSAAPGQGTGAPFSAHTPDHGGPGPGQAYGAPPRTTGPGTSAPASPFSTAAPSVSAAPTAPPVPDEGSWPDRAEAGHGDHGRDEEFTDTPAPRRGIGAWARRLKGGAKGEQTAGPETGGGRSRPSGGPDAYGAARTPDGPGAASAYGSSAYGSGARGSSAAYGSDTSGTYGSRGFPDGSADPSGDPASGAGHLASPVSPGSPFSALTSAPEGTWPDPAAVLLTALGPGPRLWERHPEHPEALVVRLGTTDRAEVPAVPVTVGLREAGSLGLAGPRARLAGLARATVAQLAALHSPFDLEIVLISTDRARPLEERRREWSWLGWLPHLRPTHGQDCCGCSSRTTVSRRPPVRPSWCAVSTRARSVPAGRIWTGRRWPRPPAPTRGRTRWSSWTATPVRRCCARPRHGWPGRARRPGSI